MSTKSRNYGLILLLSICILVVLGRYASKPMPRGVIPESSLTLAEKKTAVERDAQRAADAVPPAEQQEARRMTDCIAALEAQVRTGGTEYDRGTILIGFNKAIAFDQAKIVLSGYKLGIESEAATRESYSSNQVVTAVVPEGKEFEKICLLRAHASVRYAGLNTLFSLHQ